MIESNAYDRTYSGTRRWSSFGELALLEFIVSSDSQSSKLDKFIIKFPLFSNVKIQVSPNHFPCTSNASVTVAVVFSPHWINFANVNKKNIQTSSNHPTQLIECFKDPRLIPSVHQVEFCDVRFCGSKFQFLRISGKFPRSLPISRHLTQLGFEQHRQDIIIGFPGSIDASALWVGRSALLYIFQIKY